MQFPTMRFYFAIIGLLATLCQTSLAQPLDASTFEATVSSLREKYGARAVIAGAWQGDREISRMALGSSINGVPASTDMTIRIGGVSQWFMGTLVMKLAEQGHFSLDDKISKWLPDLYQAENVTVGMLMRNTGGYKDHVRVEEFQDLVLADPFRQFTPDELIDVSVKDRESVFPPGTSQQYSHTEFVILAKVLEKATGRSMSELYQKELLEPLGLTRTGYSETADLPVPLLHAFSSDRGVYEDSTFWSISWAGDSGPLYSTLDDLVKWAPIFGQGKLLTEKSFQELVRRPEVAPPGEVYFASGFVVSGGWYFQNPSLNGYSGMMGYLPEEDLTLMVFATQSKGSKVGHPAMKIFLDLAPVVAPEHPLSF